MRVRRRSVFIVILLHRAYNLTCFFSSSSTEYSLKVHHCYEAAQLLLYVQALGRSWSLENAASFYRFCFIFSTLAALKFYDLPDHEHSLRCKGVFRPVLASLSL